MGVGSTPTPVTDGDASGLELCLAHTASGFNSPRLHSTGLWSNGMTPLWHGGDPGSIPGGSTDDEQRKGAG